MTTPLTPLSSPQYPPQSMGERIYSRAIEAERAKTFIQEQLKLKEQKHLFKQ